MQTVESRLAQMAKIFQVAEGQYNTSAGCLVFFHVKLLVFLVSSIAVEVAQ